MKTVRQVFGLLLASLAVFSLISACSDGGGDSNEPTMIQRFVGEDGRGGTTARVDVFDDGTYQYFGIENGEFVLYAKGTYSGNPNTAGTVVISISSYLHNYEWIDAPKSLGSCNAVLVVDGQGRLKINNWREVQSWYMQLKRR